MAVGGGYCPLTPGTNPRLALCLACSPDADFEVAFPGADPDSLCRKPSLLRSSRAIKFASMRHSKYLLESLLHSRESPFSRLRQAR